MNNKNIYGFYSGGFLFDMADRIAHETASKIIHSPFVFTKSAQIRFLKQACKYPNDCDVAIVANHDMEFGKDEKIYVGVNSCKIRVKLGYKQTVYCVSDFEFVGKEKNYCEGV